MRSIGLSFFVWWGVLGAGAAVGQSTLDALIGELPGLETESPNRYCITDVQYAMDADLSWNPLLMRAVVKDDKTNLSFTLIIGSKIGRVGPDLVEWPEEPTLHEGQIYVSRGLLETVLAAYPDFRLPSQMAPDPTPTATPPPVPILEGAAPEEPPSFPGGQTDLKIKNLAVVFFPTKGEIPAASPAIGNATERLLAEIKVALGQSGIEVHPVRWDPTQQQLIETTPTDALIALQIEFASPTAKTCFFTYNAASSQDSGAGQGLFEWGKVDLEQQRSSQELAQDLLSGYRENLGEDRDIGARSGPHAVLRGRQKPAVVMVVGVDPTSAVSDLKKTAQSLGTALSRMQQN